MFKSQFQTQYAPNVPKEKIKVIPNGLVADQFDGPLVKRSHSVGWFSSYDRGLDVLLAVWPEILKAVPDATIECAYGWNAFDHMHRKNPERMKWKWQMIRKFNQFHVKDHGRLSHVALAKLMQEIQVLAYPTSFPEIDCITVKKAQAAGIDVITSGYAALQESVWSKDEPDIENIHDKPEAMQQFTTRVIDALLKPMGTAARTRIAEETKRRYDWALIAKQWSEAMQ
jgi:glycosyltransferase involved in cell wall biosynthesis